MKYYAVKNGKETGIFNSCKEVAPLVTGYKGAEFKSFTTKEEAREYLKRAIPYAENTQFDKLAEDEAISYVDGSYNEISGSCGAGIVFFTSKGMEKFNRTFKGSKYIKYRNVSGEVEAAKTAMEKAIKDGKRKLYLNYDYKGIEAWAKGDWKTNTDLTENYKKYYDKIKDELEVIFIKIKAHSGDYYNNLADELAKRAANEEKNSDIQEAK